MSCTGQRSVETAVARLVFNRPFWQLLFLIMMDIGYGYPEGALTI